MASNSDLTCIFYDLLCMTKKSEPAPDWASGLKLGAEAGEVQEAILKGRGFIEHKELNEEVVEEIADVMNVCCAILTAHYPDETPSTILGMLGDAMIKKGHKYAGILNTTVPQLGHTSNSRFDRRILVGQMERLHEYVQEELGEEANVHVYGDGSVMVEPNGRGFGFDNLELLVTKIHEQKRD